MDNFLDAVDEAVANKMSDMPKDIVDMKAGTPATIELLTKLVDTDFKNFVKYDKGKFIIKLANRNIDFAYEFEDARIYLALYRMLVIKPSTEEIMYFEVNDNNVCGQVLKHY